MGKRGRPPGSPNKPNPLHAAINSLKTKPTPHVRPVEEQFLAGKNLSNLKMDRVAHAVLKIHAMRRDVPLSWMVQDILNLWIASVTDYEQGIFTDILPRNARAPKTPERFPGYIASLGFAPLAQSVAPVPSYAPTDIPTNSLPPITPSPTPLFHETAATPAQPGIPAERLQPSLTDLTKPYVHPLTVSGAAAYAHPEPTIPQGAQLFNKRRYQETAAPPGKGSAAAEATYGQQPDADAPPLNEEVQRFLDFHKIKYDDVR